MATSGTAAFNLDLNQLVEEAFERCGQELRTGYDLRTARRSLNLMTAEWLIAVLIYGLSKKAQLV
jgi:hypothetical protein